MSATTVDSPTLAELFDRHASLVIDYGAYQTNPELKALAKRICEIGGIEVSLVMKSGLRIYRTYALVDVRETTSDGKTFLRGDEIAWRTVSVDLTD